jgi:hypothetical protein
LRFFVSRDHISFTRKGFLVKLCTVRVGTVQVCTIRVEEVNFVRSSNGSRVGRGIGFSVDNSFFRFHETGHELCWAIEEIVSGFSSYTT